MTDFLTWANYNLGTPLMIVIGAGALLAIGLNVRDQVLDYIRQRRRQP